MNTVQAGLIGLTLAVSSSFLLAADKNGPFGTREQSASAPGRVVPLAISSRHITATAKEQADSLALTEKLKALYMVMRRAPILREPRGFSMEPKLHIAVNEQDRGAPLGGELGLFFTPIYLDWTSTQFDRETGRYFTPHPNDGISFWINHPASLLGEELGRDAQGPFHTVKELTARGDGWYEHRSHRYHLLVHYDNGRMPYRPVTLERYLEHLVAEARQQAEETESESGAWQEYAATDTSGPSREELLAELQQTEKEFIASGMGRAEVEAMMKPMREALANYQPVVVDKSGIPEMAAAGESSGWEYLRALEAELSALSPQQRQAPACQYLGEPKNMPMSGLDIHCADPRGVIVEVNPGFFDRKRPRSEVQLLTVHYFPKRGGDGAFSYLDVAQTAMDAVQPSDILGALR